MSKGIKKEPFLVLIASFLTYLFTDSNKFFSYTFILRSRVSRDKGIQMGIRALNGMGYFTYLIKSSVMQDAAL